MRSRTEPGAHQRNDYEDAKQSVNDAGNGSEQVDQERNSVTDFSRRKLREKDRACESERDRKRECNHGRHKRPIDKRSCSEIVENRVPGCRPKKVPTEFGAGKVGVHPQFPNQHGGNKKNRSGESERNKVSHFIAVLESPNERTRPRIGRSRVRNRGGR